MRLLRRIKAVIFWRLFAEEKSIQALDVYVSLATTTARYTVYSALWHKLWARRTRKA